MVENLIHVEQPTPPAAERIRAVGSYRTVHRWRPLKLIIVAAVCEDLWVLPQANYASTVAPMQPYYILMKLSGSHQLEYLLMTPLTPQKRNDMISWLAARCDFPEYGEMLFYELPKGKLIYGPMQIAAMIDQNTTIAQQLTPLGPKRFQSHSRKFKRGADRELFSLRSTAVPHGGRHRLPTTQARNRDFGG